MIHVFRCEHGENYVLADQLKKKTDTWRKFGWIYYMLMVLGVIVPLVLLAIVSYIEQGNFTSYFGITEIAIGVVLGVFFFIVPAWIIKGILYKAVGDLIAYNLIMLSFDEDCFSQTCTPRYELHGAVGGSFSRVEMKYSDITRLVWDEKLQQILVIGKWTYLMKSYGSSLGWSFRQIGHFLNKKKSAFKLYRIYGEFDKVISLLEEKTGLKVEGYISGVLEMPKKAGHFTKLYGAECFYGENKRYQTLFAIAGVGSAFSGNSTQQLVFANMNLKAVLNSFLDMFDTVHVCPVCGQKTFVHTLTNDFDVCTTCGCRRDVADAKLQETYGQEE